MPTVPYSPVPQVAAQATPLPELRPSIPIEAFGSEVASAIGSAGKAVAGAGDALFERALWLQKLNNEAESRNAEADYITKTGRIQAEYNSLEGDNAVKAYPKYVSDLKALRQSVRSGLTTGDSQKQFDSQSIGTLSRGVFNASSHLATEQKKYVIQSMDAKQNAIREEVAANPNDEVGLRRGERETNDLIDQQGKLRGAPPEAIDNAKKSATSKLWASRIESQAKEYPLSGPTLLENSRQRLTEADFKRVENVVNNQRDAYGTAKIASDLIAAHTDEDGNLTIPMSELQAKARGLAEKFSPDDPGFVTKTVRALDGEFNQRKYARKQENYDNRDIVNSAILGGANSMDAILADKTAAAAYYSLPKSEQLKIPARIDNFIKSRDRQFNEQTMTTIMGLKNNDVENFLNIDPTDEKYRLQQGQIRQVQAEQAKIKKSTMGDPRVSRAMGWMKASFGPTMTAFGVRDRTKSNTDDYDHLTGTVQQALDLWQEDHKKPPTQQEFIEKIAPLVLQKNAEPGVFGLYGYGVFGTDRPTFRLDTGTKEYRAAVEKAKADIAARGGAEPSENELYRGVMREQLRKLYPPKGQSNEQR